MKSDALAFWYVTAYVIALSVAYALYPFSGHINPQWLILPIALAVPVWLAAHVIKSVWGGSQTVTVFFLCNIVAAVVIHPHVEFRDRNYIDENVQHEMLARIYQREHEPAAGHYAKTLVSAINEQMMDDYIRRNEWLAAFFPPSLILALCGVLSPIAASHIRRRAAITALPPASRAAPPGSGLS